MKNFFIAIGFFFLFCLGVAALAASVRFRPWTRPGQEDRYLELKDLVTIPVHDENEALQPKLVVDREEYDFGMLPPYTEQSCDFLISNEGDAPLVIKDGGTSCKCTMSELSAVKIAPGESFTVTLKWTTKRAEKFFHHFAKVISTDPKNTEIFLRIKGEVVESLAMDRDGVSFNLLPDESEEQSVKIYSKRWSSFSISHVELQGDEKGEISYEVLPGKLSADEFSSELKFKCRGGMTGSRTYVAKVYVNPPSEVDLSEEGAKSLLGIGRVKNGSVSIEIPITVDVKFRFNLYGKVVQPEGLIELGKLLRHESNGKSWNIICKVRGDAVPDTVVAELTGMVGIDVKVLPADDPKSFRIVIFVTDELRPVIYDNLGPHGKLMISAGLGEQYKLELPVYLDVNEVNK